MKYKEIFCICVLHVQIGWKKVFTLWNFSIFLSVMITICSYVVASWLPLSLKSEKKKKKIHFAWECFLQFHPWSQTSEPYCLNRGLKLGVKQSRYQCPCLHIACDNITLFALALFVVIISTWHTFGRKSNL